MDLDDFLNFSKIDTQNMIAEIEKLPDQLIEAWELEKKYPVPKIKNLKTIVMAGMGGSAISGDLFSAYIEDSCDTQFFVHRNYGLPQWVHGDECLVVASSHSGNTEEVLSAFDEAIVRKCPMVVISTGGKLAQKAESEKIPVWKFVHNGQPRAAIGYTFGLLLNLVFRLGLIPDPQSEIKSTVEAMKLQQSTIQAGSSIRDNPAKRLAGQMMGRLVSVYGADILSPVARRWKTQLNELAKAWSQFDILPEANHNAIAGSQNPPDELNKLFALFLLSSLQHPRNRRRLELNRESFMLEGITTDTYEAKGSNKLAQMWTAIHFGDYVSYYLAILYGVDPTPIETINWLKKSLN
jgi:glucose/mannose-6-phosphate isomerase